VILAAGVPALFAIIHIEERELRDRFGEEYVRYCARVPRFWPREDRPPGLSHFKL
jgi:protein-S-isoprenylcysteine O-methyltransferase Ste14